MKAFTYYNSTRIEFSEGKKELRKIHFSYTVAKLLSGNRISVDAPDGVQRNPLISKGAPVCQCR
jgi:hypothetical protein